MGFAVIGLWAAILRAVIQIGFDQHDGGGTVVFRGTGDHEIAHGERVAAHRQARRADDDDRLAFEVVANASQVVLIANEAGTELAVGERLHADQIGNVV